MESRPRSWFLVPALLLAACSQAPSLTTPSGNAEGTAALAEGRVGTLADGDVRVGTGPLEIVRLRMDRQTPSGVSVLRQYANPNQSYGMNVGETIELWAEYPPEVSGPRFRVDWGDGTVDITGCGSCLLTHTYPLEGSYIVRATLDDRVSTTATRTFTLESRGPRVARRLVFALDNTNGYVGELEAGARISHRGGSGAGPLMFSGLEMAFGPASTAVFPGATQLGDGVGPAGGSSRPRNYVSGALVFTLRATGTGTLYQGTMTFWADAGDGFCCPDGTPPLPGNPNFASVAFDLTEILP